MPCCFQIPVQSQDHSDAVIDSVSSIFQKHNDGVIIMPCSFKYQSRQQLICELPFEQISFHYKFVFLDNASQMRDHTVFIY